MIEKLRSLLFLWWHSLNLASRKRLTCYLVGPMQDAKDGGVRWRERITPKLNELGVTVLDPTVIEAQDYGSIEEAQKTLRNLISTGNWEAYDEKLDDIIRRDIDAVYRSTFIVAYYDPEVKMGGTLCELWESAYHRKIPVYVVCHSPKKDWNMWMLRTVRSTGIVFDSWVQLMDYLEEKYNKSTETRNEAVVQGV